MKFHVIIPARFASTRLHAKSLLDIAGKPLIQHVFERAVETGAPSIIIATDDGRIGDVARKFGARVCMTSADHQSGTDRLAEAAEKLGIPDGEVVVNLQGDEPQMPADLIRQVAALLDDPQGAEMATLYHGISESADLFDPNVVKLVTNRAGEALYFSRAPVPWHRNDFTRGKAASTLPEVSTWKRHIGIYAYRAGFLKTYTQLPACVLEQIECLEQLRVLYHGYRIRAAEALMPSGLGIDTSADLERVRAAFEVS